VIRLRCPICGEEIAFNFKGGREPVGGLYEIVVQHRNHWLKVFIDRQGVVRRATPVEYFVVVDPPKYTLYVYEGGAEVREEGVL